jgi:non-specific serine/threonine protein kinase
VSSTWQAPRWHCEQQARTELGEDRYRAAYARGAAVAADLGDAIDHVLTIADALAAPAPAVSATLTSRELEVAELAAAGASNKEIAARLVISTRTAEKHLANILKKLGLASRAQLAAWVVDRRT